MKLRYQIMILLGVPMLSQLVTVSWLYASFQHVDEVARQEAKAKKVIALCQISNGLLGQLVMELVAPNFFGATENAHLLQVLPLRIRGRTREIRETVADNPVAVKIINRYDQNAQRYLDNLQDLIHGYNPESNRFLFSQFISDREFTESTKVLLDMMVADLDTILSMYGKAADEFQPQAIKARDQLRILIFALVTANVVIVAGLAVIVNRNTLSRLQVLMQNMQRFSRGQKDGYERLNGTDELAELDQAFKEMSDERNRLDEIRKSLQAMVSHDLRSPLSSINLTVELILGVHAESLKAEVVKLLERMHSQLLRLSRLARTLLDVEKIEDGHLEVIMRSHSVHSLIDSALAAVISLAEHTQVKFKTEYDQELSITCDEDRTIQVLVNFLSNAIKFAPEGSTITVSCQLVPGPQAASGTASKSKARFEIIDQGPGVPDDQAGKLFEKFRQLDQPSEVRKQGSGLGLFICRMLIAAQGGEIGYRRADSGGSCFWFELPN